MHAPQVLPCASISSLWAAKIKQSDMQCCCLQSWLAAEEQLLQEVGML